jgi:Ca2+-binding EF-hand superfamily protein
MTTFGATTASARQAKVISSGATYASPGTYTSAIAPRTVIQGGATIMPASTRIVSGALAPQTTYVSATGYPASQPNILAQQSLTQSAYEVKHKDDPQLQNLKELRKTCGLKTVPVNDALQTFKQAAGDGKLTRDQFYGAYAVLLQNSGVEVPGEDVQKAVFDLFDRDDNGVVDMMELICGASLLCTGTEEDKIHAVFNVFDENGDGVISMDEMFKFLTSVFKVVLTPNVMKVMDSMGVAVESPEDLASVTALECFKTADLNHDGRLSVVEFKNWFFAPRNDPSFLFSPVRKLLQ